MFNPEMEARLAQDHQQQLKTEAENYRLTQHMPSLWQVALDGAGETLIRAGQKLKRQYADLPPSAPLPQPRQSESW